MIFVLFVFLLFLLFFFVVAVANKSDCFISFCFLFLYFFFVVLLKLSGKCCRTKTFCVYKMQP